MVLRIEIVTEELTHRPEDVVPDFPQDTRSDASWWCDDSAKSPVSYCRFLDADHEVARAKVLPKAGEYRGYTSWSCPHGGVTEIDLIEVRMDLRRSGHRYGRRAVQEICRQYGDPIVALSLDDASDAFWNALGWNAHTHPDDDEYHKCRTLFTSI